MFKYLGDGYYLKRMKQIGLLFVLIFFGLLYSCGTSGEKESVNTEQQDQNITDLSGKQLSLAYCQSCHQYPEPGLLDKRTWQQSVLPEMGRYYGIYQDSVTRSDVMKGAINKNLVEQQNIFPEDQLISNEKWEVIKDYYLSSAPDSLPPNKSDEIEFVPLQEFETIVPSFGLEITMVEIDPERSQIYIGETKGGSGVLTRLDSNFEILSTIEPPTPPVDISIRRDGLAVTLVGTLVLSRSNNPFGELVRLSPTPGGGTRLLRFPDPLMRPLQTVFEDVDGDGFEDILIAEFGYYTGALALYKNRGGTGSSYKRTVLKNVSGALRTYVRDMNSDGHKDIIALFAQGDEGISIFYNDGQGGFSEEQILRFSPSYGSVYFELVDFNDDGSPDILYCNGDNGDYPPILKDYHGIRIFENDGNNNFEQVYFFPMYGAYKCSAADFDLDGDQDLIAISYFPDRNAEKRRDFVYLENNGDYSFSPQFLQNDMSVRWTTFDIADLNKDGYKDILLGGFSTYVTYEDTTGQQRKKLPENGSLLLLKNLGK
jgi:hypothetical protein